MIYSVEKACFCVYGLMNPWKNLTPPHHKEFIAQGLRTFSLEPGPSRHDR